MIPPAACRAVIEVKTALHNMSRASAPRRQNRSLFRTGHTNKKRPALPGVFRSAICKISENHTLMGISTQSNINIPSPKRIGLNKVPTRLHFIPHQHGEHAIGFNRIVNLHTQQTTHRGIHRGFPQL